MKLKFSVGFVFIVLFGICGFAYAVPTKAAVAKVPSKAKAVVKTKAKAVKTKIVAKTTLEATSVTKEAVVVKKPIVFKDLAKKDPAYPYIMKIVGTYEVMSGYPDKTFRGYKAVTKTDLIKTTSDALKYLEKKFYLPISFEAKSDKSKNTTTRLVAAQILSNAYDSVLLKYETTGEAFNIPLKKAEKKIGLDRATLAIYCTKFLDKSVDLISKLPKDKLESLYRKNGIQSKPNEVVLPAVQVQKQMSLGKPKAYVSGAYGNIIESASTTNNWLGFAGSAAYGNTFQVQGVNGDYELTGKYQYNQVISLVPRSGGAISGGTISEYRSDLDLNTIYPVADYYGYKGLLLVGLKSANMMNPIAPVSLLAVNLGVATTTVVMNRNVFGRVYYSLILNATKATSVLGTPSSILNYEAGIDFDVMKTPMLVGYSGETMFLDAGYSRFYNMVFLRYFLI